jgi:YegS/Rv2252/BmrU family lipid kinase
MTPPAASPRTLVVVNPASSGGRTALRWTRIGHALRSLGVDHDVHRTTGPGDATLAVRAALRDGVDRIISVGGDGTLNEVVNGFFDEEGRRLRDATLALVPSGTGGDFRRSAGIPVDADDCAHLIAHAPGRRIDAGRIDFGDGRHRFFVNIADCGIGGEVVAAVNRSRFKGGGARGSAVFLGISLRTLLRFRGRPVRVVLDGSETIEESVQSVVVANGRYFGGGMQIAPEARLDDGRFDVVVVAALGRRRSLTSLPSLYRGTHLGNPGVRLERARRVEIRALDGPLLFDVEGEQVGETPATLTCLPGAINLAAPAGG